MKNNYFYIRVPYFGAWSKYGWARDDWGIGLEKNKIDFLASKNSIAIVSFWKTKKEYTISAKKVQTYPVERIKGYNTFVYIIPKSILNYRKKVEEKELTDEEILKIATS